MAYKLTKDQMNEVLANLSEKYKVVGPKWDKPHKNIKFLPIKSIDELVLDAQSNFSIKEAFYPISQVMFYFKADNVEDSEILDDRDILIFARPCDINSVMPLDKIFLYNGSKEGDDNQDVYYKRLREKVKFALLPCNGGFENCFCVSTNTNTTDNYAFAVKPGDECLVEVKDDAFAEVFKAGSEVEYKPEFVEKNDKVLALPNISKDNIEKISQMDYWNQFDEKCIGCGGCNTVCGTCSCFDTVDVVYNEGHSDGERRRVWSSCMLDTFTLTAGGGRSRKTKGANMRFKVFHKFYDFKARFDADRNMCSGCGRCDMRCPQGISFFDTVCGLAKECEE